MNSHIYNVSEMKEWTPKKVYHGAEGYINYFLDGINSTLNKDIDFSLIDEKFKQEYLKYINSIRNLTLLEKKKNKIKQEIKQRLRKLFAQFIDEFEEGQYTEKTCYFMNIDEKTNHNVFNICIDCNGEDEKVGDYGYSINKYYEYINSDKNKIHRLNNKNYAKNQKNVYELIYLLKTYYQNSNYLYFNCLLNTFWDKPFVEFE